MLTILILVAVIAYSVYWRFINREFRQKLSKFKSDPGIPLLGNALQLGFSNEELLPALEKFWIKFGRERFLVKIGNLTQVVITKPQDVEVILSNTQLLTKGRIYSALQCFLGNGLVTSYGEYWRINRKMQTPAFHFKILETYLDIFENEIKLLLNKLEVKPNTDVDIYPLFNRTAFVTMGKINLGFDMKSNENLETYLEAVRIIARITNEKLFSVWKSINFIFDMTPEGKLYNKAISKMTEINKVMLHQKAEKLKDMINSVASGEQTMQDIVERDEIIGKRKLTLIELLLLSRTPSGEFLTEKEIIDQVNTYMFAGHETTASAASFLVYALSQHPDVQQKVYEEQLQITNGDLKKPITYRNLHELKYLDRVIKESMRVYPTAPMFSRQITENIVFNDGVELPIGVDVILIPFFTFKDPAVFENPDKFDPDRFLEGKSNSYAYYPFSAGPRNCIGQKLAILQLKYWVSSIIRCLEILPANAEPPMLKVEMSLKSDNGIHVQFRPRLET